jgi:polyphosphate kinase
MVYGEPKKVLHSIHEIVLAQRERFETVFAEARAALENEGIFIVDEKRLLAEHRSVRADLFRRRGAPESFPGDPRQPRRVPVSAQRRDLPRGATLGQTRNPQSAHSLVEIPAGLPRFLVLPAVADKRYVIMLDDVIRFG